MAPAAVATGSSRPVTDSPRGRATVTSSTPARVRILTSIRVRRRASARCGHSRSFACSTILPSGLRAQQPGPASTPPSSSGAGSRSAARARRTSTIRGCMRPSGAATAHTAGLTIRPAASSQPTRISSATASPARCRWKTPRSASAATTTAPTHCRSSASRRLSTPAAATPGLKSSASCASTRPGAASTSQPT